MAKNTQTSDGAYSRNPGGKSGMEGRSQGSKIKAFQESPNTGGSLPDRLTTSNLSVDGITDKS